MDTINSGMIGLIVLLEKDFKNSLGNEPRGYISGKINMSRGKTNSMEDETKHKSLVKDFIERLDNDKGVVEIFPEDIDSASGTDDYDDHTELKPIDVDECQDDVFDEGKKRKSTNDSRKNSKKSKNEIIKDENQSDSEYDHYENQEFDNLSDEYSDWEVEKLSPYKSAKKKKGTDNDGDCDPNKTVINEVIQKSSYFTCTICQVQVRTPSEKEAHKQTHGLRYLSFETLFRCLECTVEFKHPIQFRVHYQKHHSTIDGFYEWKKCTECAFKTSSNKYLKMHMLHHTRKGTFQCEFCSFSHDHKKNITRHLQLHNQFLTGIFSCKECSYTTKHYSSLLKHTRSAHIPDEQKKWLKCKECPFKAMETCGIKKHMACHELSDGYKCPHCTYSTHYACRLTDHIKIHFGEGEEIPEYDPKLQTPLYSCPRCSYKTMARTHLDRHMAAHKKQADRRLSCAECPFTCKDKLDLITHVKCHNGEGKLKCPWCSFCHRATGILTKHQRLHNNDREKKFLKIKHRKGRKEPRCPICKELFKGASYLKRHMLKHQTIDEVANPFLCALCPYRSKNKDGSFIGHVHSHFKKDGIKCDFCSFRHDRQNVMTTHMRLHKDKAIQIKEEPEN